MKVTIYGSGYVGLVTGSLLADVGNDVLCVDVDQEKVDNLNQGIIPIHEPGLDSIISRNHQAGRLRFTSDRQAAVDHSEVQMIAVGTPPDEDGSADLKHVLAVATTIGELMSNHKIIINKSTVPVGTADKVASQVQKTLDTRGSKTPFEVASNPEFLKEGAAINDFMKPDRIVVGTESEHVKNKMRELYAPFVRNHDRLIFMDVRSSELTKYAANSMLATKISFMNELSNLADRLGADIENVRIGIGSDPRIGYHFIYPGCGYGGSCFPKDVKALVASAQSVGYKAELLSAVEEVNNRQKQILFKKINAYFNGNLKGKTIALWGLAFKPNTDDMREAPSRELIEALIEAGATVQAYDPVAMPEARHIYPDPDHLKLAGTALDAVNGADALAIVTEWREFRSPSWDVIKKQLKSPVVFDGRNLYDSTVLADHGIDYKAIGRPN